jgi:hypothetical protein
MDGEAWRRGRGWPAAVVFGLRARKAGGDVRFFWLMADRADYVALGRAARRTGWQPVMLADQDHCWRLAGEGLLAWSMECWAFVTTALGDRLLAAGPDRPVWLEVPGLWLQVAR